MRRSPRWLRARPLPPLEPVWLTELARLLPELLVTHPGLPPPEPLREAWQRNRLFEALARGVLCCGRPRLFVLDDLHWCDPDTLAWLHYLLRFNPSAALLVDRDAVHGRKRPSRAGHPVGGAAPRGAGDRDRTGSAGRPVKLRPWQAMWLAGRSIQPWPGRCSWAAREILCSWWRWCRLGWRGVKPMTGKVGKPITPAP